MVEENNKEPIPITSTEEVQRLREEKRVFRDSLTPPFSDEEREALDNFDRQILEATARAIETRKGEEQ